MYRVLETVFACGFAALVGLSVSTVQGSTPAAVPCTWKNVQMVGGGFVDGIVFHSTARGVRYARTDMGGAYRWNEQSKRCGGGRGRTSMAPAKLGGWGIAE